MAITMERCKLKCSISNKKAGAPVDEFIAFLVFMVIAAFTIYFVNLVKFSDEKEATSKIEQQKLIEGSQPILTNFLKYQTQDKQNSDVIVDSYSSKDYSQIEQAARSFFNEIYQDEWILVIKDSKNDVVFSTDSDSSLKGNIVETDYSIRTVQKGATAYLPLSPYQDVTYLETELLIRIPKEGVRVT